jgi:hypothetical protein
MILFWVAVGRLDIRVDLNSFLPWESPGVSGG